MKVDRCPNCNKIISPQETVCSNCGAKLDNRSVKRINSIYHRSNVATFAYLIIFNFSLFGARASGASLSCIKEIYVF